MPEVIDFAVITALRVERRAVVQRLDGPVTKVQEDDDPFTYYKGYVNIPGSDERYTVVVVELGDMGNDEAGITTAQLNHRWRPEAVLMVGIAGGVPQRVALGDVVVADFSFYYEPAKLTLKGMESRPKQFHCDRHLYLRAKAYEESEWKGEIGSPRPDHPDDAAAIPNALVGPIASGEKVVADEGTLARLLDECPKLVAVAMEGAGVARAALLNSRPPRFLEIRGICDFADPNKNDGWHEYAANAAAAFTVGFLRSRPIRPTLAYPGQGEVHRPLLVLRAQSLRPIGSTELADALALDFPGRDFETVSLDLTACVEGGVVADPQGAVHQLMDPRGALLGALTRRGEAEFVFHGLAHIPFVVLAGHIVGDRQPVRFFDLQSAGPGSWSWPMGGLDWFPELDVRLPKQWPQKGEILIRFSVSYLVSEVQTKAIGIRPAAAIDIRAPRPQRGIVQSERQVREYGATFRKVLDTCVQSMPACCRLHLCYAGPVALAFHIGQQISENIHPPVTVWNYSRRYDWGIDLDKATRGELSTVRPAETHGEGA